MRVRGVAAAPPWVLRSCPFFLLIGVLGVLLAPALSGQTAVQSASTPTTGESVVAHLQYREVDFSPACYEISVQPGVAFPKEPQLGGKTFRGLLVLGADTNQFVPFAWDSDRQKLFLDLNRNRDLTDDPGGTLTAPGRELQLFKGIPLQFTSPQGIHHVLVDAHVFGSDAKPRVFLYVRSLWDGSVELNSKKWYVAVIDLPDGRIGPATALNAVGDRMVLRPWDERDTPLLWWHASLQSVHSLDHVKLVTFPYRWAGNAEVLDAFSLPRSLFFEGQGYRLDYRVESTGRPENLALTFTPASPVLAKLRLDGDNIRRVVLDNSISSNGYTSVLHSPAAEATIPEGVYPRQVVLLQREGFTNLAAGVATNELSVTEDHPTNWIAGGPLKSVVEMNHSYGGLTLYYRLTNNSGMSFGMAFQDAKAPPRFEVRAGDKLIDHGKFKFG